MTYEYHNQFFQDYQVKRASVKSIPDFEWNSSWNEKDKIRTNYTVFNKDDFEIIATFKDYPEDKHYLISQIGEFSNTYIEGNSTRTGNTDYRFFNLNKSYQSRFKDFRQQGLTRHESDCCARKSMRDDYIFVKKIKSGEIYSRDLLVEAYKKDILLGKSQLSCILNTETNTLIKEKVNNLATEAVSIAQNKLEELRRD